MSHKGSRLLSLLESGKAKPFGDKAPLSSAKPGTSRVRSSTQISSPPSARNSNPLHIVSTNSNVTQTTGGSHCKVANTSRTMPTDCTGLRHCQSSSLQFTSRIVCDNDAQTSEDTDAYRIMLASVEETSYATAHVSQGRVRSSISSLSTSIFSSRTSRASATDYMASSSPPLIDDTSSPVMYPYHTSSPVGESSAPTHQAPTASAFAHSPTTSAGQPLVRSRVRAQHAAMTDTSVLDASSCRLTPASSSSLLSSLSSSLSSSHSLSSPSSFSSSSSHTSLFSSSSSCTPTSLFSPQTPPVTSPSSSGLFSYDTRSSSGATPGPVSTTATPSAPLAIASDSVSATAPVPVSAATSAGTFSSTSTSTPISALTYTSSTSSSSSRRSRSSASSLSASLFTPSESASQLSRAQSRTLSRAQSRSQLSQVRSDTRSHTHTHAQIHARSQSQMYPLTTATSTSTSTSASASASASTSVSAHTTVPQRPSSRLAHSRTRASPPSLRSPSLSTRPFPQPHTPLPSSAPALSSRLSASSPGISGQHDQLAQHGRHHHHVYSRATDEDPPTLTALLLALLQGRPSQSVAHLLAHTATQLRTHFSPLVHCLSDALVHTEQQATPASTHPTSDANAYTSMDVHPGAGTGTGARMGLRTGNATNAAARRREATALLGSLGVTALEAALAYTTRASHTPSHATHTTRARHSARQPTCLPQRVLALAADLHPLLTLPTPSSPAALHHHLPPHVHAALLPPVPMRVCRTSPLLLASVRQLLEGGADPLWRDADGACALWLAVQGGPPLPQIRAGADDSLIGVDIPLGLGQHDLATGRGSVLPTPTIPALSPAEVLACLLSPRTHIDHALQRRLRRAAPAGPHMLAAALRETDDAGMGASALVSSLLEHVHGLHSLRAVVGMFVAPMTRQADAGLGGATVGGVGVEVGIDSDNSEEEAQTCLYVSQLLCQRASATLSHTQPLAYRQPSHNTTPRRVLPAKVRVETPEGALYLRVVTGPAATATTTGHARGLSAPSTRAACKAAAALAQPTRHSSGRYWQWPLPDVALVCGNATAALLLLEAGALPSGHGYVAGAHAEALRLRCGVIVEDIRGTEHNGGDAEEDVAEGLQGGAEGVGLHGSAAARADAMKQVEGKMMAGMAVETEAEANARTHVELMARLQDLDAQRHASQLQVAITTSAMVSPSTFVSPHAPAPPSASACMSPPEVFSSPQLYASQHYVSEAINATQIPAVSVAAPSVEGKAKVDGKARGAAAAASSIMSSSLAIEAVAPSITAASTAGIYPALDEDEAKVSPTTLTAHAEAHLSLDASTTVFLAAASPVPRLRSRRAATHAAHAKPQAVLTASTTANVPVNVTATALANMVDNEAAPVVTSDSCTAVQSPWTITTDAPYTTHTTLATLATRGHAAPSASATPAMTTTVTGAVARPVPAEGACDVFMVDACDDVTTVKRSRLRAAARQPMPTVPLPERHAPPHAPRTVPHSSSTAPHLTAFPTTALARAKSPSVLCATTLAQAQSTARPHETTSPPIVTDAFYTPHPVAGSALAPAALSSVALPAPSCADSSPMSVQTLVAPVSVAGVFVRVGDALVQCVSSALVGPLPSDNTRSVDTADNANNNGGGTADNADMGINFETHPQQHPLPTASLLVTRAHSRIHVPPHVHTASLPHAPPGTHATSLAYTDPLAASMAEECKRDEGAEAGSPYTALLASPTLGEVLLGPRKGYTAPLNALAYAASSAPLTAPRPGARPQEYLYEPSSGATYPSSADMRVEVAPPFQATSRSHLPRESGLLCSPRTHPVVLDAPIARPLGLLEAAELLYQQRIAEELNAPRGTRMHKITPTSSVASPGPPTKRGRASPQHPLTASYSFADALSASQPPPPWRVRQLLDAGLWAALVAAGHGNSAAAREEMGSQRDVPLSDVHDGEGEPLMPSMVSCICECPPDAASGRGSLLTRLACSHAWAAVCTRISVVRQAAQKPTSFAAAAADSVHVQQVVGLLAHGADAWAPGCVARGLRRRVMVGADDNGGDHSGEGAHTDAMIMDEDVEDDGDVSSSQLRSDSEDDAEDEESPQPRKRRRLRSSAATHTLSKACVSAQWPLEEDEVAIIDANSNDSVTHYLSESPPMPVAPISAAAQPLSSALSQGSVSLIQSRSLHTALPDDYTAEAPLADSLSATLPLDADEDADLGVYGDAVMRDNDVSSVDVRSFSSGAPHTQRAQHTPYGSDAPTASHGLPVPSTPARRPTSVLARLSARLSSRSASALASAGAGTKTDTNTNANAVVGVDVGVGAKSSVRGARSSACVYRGPVEWERGAWALFYECAWSQSSSTHAARAQPSHKQYVCAQAVHSQSSRTRADLASPGKVGHQTHVRGVVPYMPPARDTPIMAAVHRGCSPAVLKALLAFARVTDTCTHGHAWLRAAGSSPAETGDHTANGTGADLGANADVMRLSTVSGDVPMVCSRYCAAEVAHVSSEHAQWLPRSARCVMDEVLMANAPMGDERVCFSEDTAHSQMQQHPHPHPSPRQWLELLSLRGPQGVSALGLAVLLQAVDLARVLARAGADVMQPLYADHSHRNSVGAPHSPLPVGGYHLSPGHSTHASELGSARDSTRSILAHALQQRAWPLVAALVEGAVEHSLALRTPLSAAEGEPRATVSSPKRGSIPISDEYEENAGSSTRRSGHVACCPALCLPWLSPSACMQRSYALTHATYALQRAGMLDRKPLTLSTALVSADAEADRLALDAAWDAAYRTYEETMVPLPCSQLFVDD